jgi:hypothetical protein
MALGMLALDFFITFGSCHHLDALVQHDSIEALKLKIMMCFKGDCERLLCSFLLQIGKEQL